MDLVYQNLDREKMKICSICQNIPFLKLPSEHELGFPHQPSLTALQSSAQTCRLCYLILWSIGCCLAGEGGMTKCLPQQWLPEDIRVPTNVWSEPNRNKWGMRAESNGCVNLEPRGPIFVDFSGHLQIDMKILSTQVNADELKPWLFANWFKQPGAPNEEQYMFLMGLGARLGTGPNIKQALGNSEERINFRGTFIRIRIDDHATIEAKVPGRLCTRYPSSDLAMKRLEEFIKMCNEHHSCIKVDGSNLPTRILQISPDSKKVFVRECSNNEKAKYISVIHKWTPSEKLPLMWQKLLVEKHELEVSDLDKTFQDVVSIAKRLKISYIWAFPLIVEKYGSLADWKVENWPIDEVFQNSYLTVSATGSTDDSKGCFLEPRFLPHYLFSSDTVANGRRCIPFAAPLVHEDPEPNNLEESSRGPSLLKHTIWNLFARIILSDDVNVSKLYEPPALYFTPEWLPSSVKGIQLVPRDYMLGYYCPTFDPLEAEALMLDPWAFQQRLFAPRIIHYAVQQMYWECSHLWAEDGLAMYRKFQPAKWILGRIPDYSTDDLTWPDPWFQIIEQFSTTKALNEDDRLLAIARLAKLWADRSGDQYIAGIWKKNLIAGLSWSAEVPTQHNTNEVKVPINYRAPSWSWASLDAIITFDPIKRNEICTEVLEVSVTPASESSFGSLSKGFIKLKGPLFEVKMETPEVKHKDVAFSQSFTFVILDEEITASATVDHPSKLPTHAISLTPSKALLLQSKEGGINLFTRVGTALFYKDLPFPALSKSNTEEVGVDSSSTTMPDLDSLTIKDSDGDGKKSTGSPTELSEFIQVINIE